mgnify:CR=1 FL=1
MDSISTLANLSHTIKKRNDELEKCLHDVHEANRREEVSLSWLYHAQIVHMHEEICSLEKEMEDVLFECVEVSLFYCIHSVVL